MKSKCFSGGLALVLLVGVSTVTNAFQQSAVVPPPSRPSSFSSSSPLLRQQEQVRSSQPADTARRWHNNVLLVQERDENEVVPSSGGPQISSQCGNAVRSGLSSMKSRFHLISALKKFRFSPKRSASSADIACNHVSSSLFVANPNNNIKRTQQIRLWWKSFWKKLVAMVAALFFVFSPALGGGGISTTKVAHAADYFAPPSHARLVPPAYQTQSLDEEQETSADDDALIDEFVEDVLNAEDQAAQEKAAVETESTAAPSFPGPDATNLAMARVAKSNVVAVAEETTSPELPPPADPSTEVATTETAAVATAATATGPLQQQQQKNKNKKIMMASLVGAGVLGATLGVKLSGGSILGNSDYLSEDDDNDDDLFRNNWPDTGLGGGGFPTGSNDGTWSGLDVDPFSAADAFSEQLPEDPYYGEPHSDYTDYDSFPDDYDDPSRMIGNGNVWMVGGSISRMIGNNGNVWMVGGFGQFKKEKNNNNNNKGLRIGGPAGTFSYRPLFPRNYVGTFSQHKPNITVVEETNNNKEEGLGLFGGAAGPFSQHQPTSNVTQAETEEGGGLGLFGGDVGGFSKYNPATTKDADSSRNEGFELFSNISGYKIGYSTEHSDELHDDDDGDDYVGGFGGNKSFNVGGAAGTFSQYRPTTPSVDESDKDGEETESVGFAGTFSQYRPDDDEGKKDGAGLGLFGGSAGTFSEHQPVGGFSQHRPSLEDVKESLPPDIEVNGNAGTFSQHRPDTSDLSQYQPEQAIDEIAIDEEVANGYGLDGPVGTFSGAKSGIFGGFAATFSDYSQPDSSSDGMESEKAMESTVAAGESAETVEEAALPDETVESTENKENLDAVEGPPLDALDTPSPDAVLGGEDEEGISASAFRISPGAILNDVEQIERMGQRRLERVMEEEDNVDDDEEDDNDDEEEEEEENDDVDGEDSSASIEVTEEEVFLHSGEVAEEEVFLHSTEAPLETLVDERHRVITVDEVPFTEPLGEEAIVLAKAETVITGNSQVEIASLTEEFLETLSHETHQAEKATSQVAAAQLKELEELEQHLKLAAEDLLTEDSAAMLKTRHDGRLISWFDDMTQTLAEGMAEKTPIEEAARPSVFFFATKREQTMSAPPQPEDIAVFAGTLPDNEPSEGTPSYGPFPTASGNIRSTHSLKSDLLLTPRVESSSHQAGNEPVRLIPVNEAAVELTSGLLGAAVGFSVGGPVLSLLGASAANYASRDHEHGDVHHMTQMISASTIGSVNLAGAVLHTFHVDDVVLGAVRKDQPLLTSAKGTLKAAGEVLSAVGDLNFLLVNAVVDLSNKAELKSKASSLVSEWWESSYNNNNQNSEKKESEVVDA